MRKPIFTVCAVLMLALAVAAVAAGPALASQRTANEAIMLQLINHARTQRGLAPLHVRAALSRAALAHSRDMMRHQYFSHSSLGGATVAGRARSAGYSVSVCSLGEVIALGSSRKGTPESMFKGWMRSSTHRQVILAKRWRDVGVGCASGSYKGFSGVVMYTVDFGRRAQ